MRLFKRGGTTAEIEVATGCPVFSADNEALGYVKEVGAETFQVDVPMGQDYWLSINHVRSCNDKELILDFSKGELDDYKLEGPSGIEKAHEAPIENEFVTQAHGSIITDEEQMQTRERMEREMAEQHQKLNDN